jgi:hypothetical protein
VQRLENRNLLFDDGLRERARHQPLGDVSAEHVGAPTLKIVDRMPLLFDLQRDKQAAEPARASKLFAHCVSGSFLQNGLSLRIAKRQQAMRQTESFEVNHRRRLTAHKAVIGQIKGNINVVSPMN